MTVADQPRVEAAEARLIAILHKVGAEGYENIAADEPSALDPILEKLTYALSQGSLIIFGGGSPVDKFLEPVKTLVKTVFEIIIKK